MKPLGGKAYGHIGHLPCSRMGAGDHHVHEGQAKICTEQVRDRFDVVVVQEKLDGSCCSVARLDDGSIVPLSRAGYVADTSKYIQHRMFYDWVFKNRERFLFLDPGERCVGEWMVQAHSTKYKLEHEPFVLFDIMRKSIRVTYMELLHRVIPYGFTTPNLVSYGASISVENVMKRLRTSGHGALDPVEGAVWRLERKGVVDFLAKFVRPAKEDGIYLPSVTGLGEVWNLYPPAV